MDGMSYGKQFYNPQNSFTSPNDDYGNMYRQQLEFQSFTNDNTNVYYGQIQDDKPNMEQYSTLQPQESFTSADEYDEPPLLDELEIFPDRILEKTIAALNPFRSHSLADDADFIVKDTDIAGPIFYCLVLGCCLFISGHKESFGYIYAMVGITFFMMYMLLTLMTVSDGIFTIMCVVSIMGYCLLPIVGLSAIGIFISLQNTVGMVLALIAVIWSSLSAPRLFVAVSGDNEQRPLIGYPCALVYGMFALLVVF